MTKQSSTPITTAMTMDSLPFLRWMPSISRPNPGTFAVSADSPPEEPVRELRCPANAFLVSNAWL